MEVHEEAVSLADLSAVIEASSKAKFSSGSAPRIRDGGGGVRQPATARRRLRHRRAKRDPRIHAADERSAADRRSAVVGRASASSGARGRRYRLKPNCRSISSTSSTAHPILVGHRLQRRPRHRPDLCWLPPLDVPRPPHHAREPLAAVRSQELLHRMRRARADIAGELRHRLASAGLSRRRAAAPDRRVRPGGDLARRTGPDGARAHQRGAGAG